MATLGPAALTRPQVRWRWIDGPGDLVWYIGSAALGWAYVAIIFLLGRGLADPLRDVLWRVEVPGFSLALTLELLVVLSWAYLVDAPHVCATLLRTYLDPDEWRVRRGPLLLSHAWFLAGPAAIALPYLLGGTQAAGAGAAVFAVFFRLWAYYHVVRQHWGFLALYRRKGDDPADRWEHRADLWFFRAGMYLPLLAFVTAPWYAQTRMPALGLERLTWNGAPLTAWLHPVLRAALVLACVGYAVFQVVRWRAGRPRNGPKLLFLASTLPLHFAAFSHPLLALFLVPIVTIGHNVQYHRIVWSFGQRKYVRSDDTRYRWVRPLFRSPWLYALAGFAFTFALYRGPWVNGVKGALGRALDGWLFAGAAAAVGTRAPDTLTLGAQVAAWLITGFAMQHYYLDSKIWRVSKDREVARALDA